MSNKKVEIGFIHGAVLLFGLSGIFAKLISYYAFILVLGRMFFAALFLLFVLLIWKIPFRLVSLRDIGKFFLIGIILVIHWSSFFYSIQISSVAIGLITFATFPVFSVFLEPLLLKETFKKKNIVIALITLFGVLLIVQEVSFENTSFLGAFWGIVSAFTFSLLAIINRVLVRGYSSIVVGFYQNSFGFIVLIPFLFLFPFQFQLDNFLLLVLLGVLFTGVSHVMFIQGLKSVNVQKASVIACLEPVYGIIAAVVILAEIPSLREGVGILIILCMAIYVSFYNAVE